MDKKRPTWATIVGVLGIILACLGILGAWFDLTFSQLMDQAKQMSSQMDMEHMLETPGWLGIFFTTTGILKLIFCGFAFLASIFLLQIKPSSIKLFYWAAGLNIGLAILRSLILLASKSFVVISAMFSGIFGLVVNIILISVVALGKKDAFAQDTQIEA